MEDGHPDGRLHRRRRHGVGYEWTWNTQVGPVPLLFQLEAGAAGAIEFQAALDHVKNGNDYLTELRLYAGSMNDWVGDPARPVEASEAVLARAS